MIILPLLCSLCIHENANNIYEIFYSHFSVNCNLRACECVNGSVNVNEDVDVDVNGSVYAIMNGSVNGSVNVSSGDDLHVNQRA